MFRFFPNSVSLIFDDFLKNLTTFTLGLFGEMPLYRHYRFMLLLLVRDGIGDWDWDLELTLVDFTSPVT